MTSYKNCSEVSADVAIGAGKARLTGVSADQLKILKHGGGNGELVLGALTVDSISGATLTHLGHAVVDGLTSTSATDLLSANQGRIIKGYIDAINTLLASDNTALDTLQEIVDFIENNKDLIDNLAISNISGLQNELNTRLHTSGGTMYGDVTMQGKDITFIQGGKVEFSAGGVVAALSLNSDNYFEVNKDIYTPQHIRADGNIIVGGTVDGRDIALMGTRQDNELMRVATINKDSGENDIGSALAAGSLVGEVFAVVTEAFNNDAYIELGTAADKDQLCVLAAEDLSVINKKIHLSPVVYFADSTQIQYKVYSGGSVGQVKVYFKPMM